MGVGLDLVPAKTWTVSRFRRDPGFTGLADDCHTVYALTATTLEQHCRVRAATARKVSQRLERGRRVRRPRRRVDLRALQEVSFDPDASRLVLDCGRFARTRLDPANAEEAVAIEEIYETLRERGVIGDGELSSPSGWHRLARAVPAPLAGFGSVGGAVAFASGGWGLLAALEVVVLTVILYRYATGAGERPIEVARRGPSGC